MPPLVPPLVAGTLGCSGWDSSVQSSINAILPPLRTFWLLTTHWACGTSLPTAPAKLDGTPWARRIATALAYGSPTTLRVL